MSSESCLIHLYSRKHYVVSAQWLIAGVELIDLITFENSNY